MTVDPRVPYEVGQATKSGTWLSLLIESTTAKAFDRGTSKPNVSNHDWGPDTRPIPSETVLYDMRNNWKFNPTIPLQTLARTTARKQTWQSTFYLRILAMRTYEYVTGCMRCIIT